MRWETAGAVQARLLTAAAVARHMATAIQRDEAAKRRNRAVSMRTEDSSMRSIWRQPYSEMKRRSGGIERSNAPRMQGAVERTQIS